MRVGDVIEIVTHEGTRLNIRRVKIDRVRKTGGCGCGDDSCSNNKQVYAVKASNLKNKYQRSYTLPLEPITDVRDPELRDCVNWIVPNDLNGKADP